MNRLMRWIHIKGSPENYYRLAGRLIPWFAIPGLLLLVTGIVYGLVFAPPDYQQGDAYRIIFIHVPSAWMSLFIYLGMSVAAAIALIWRIKVAELTAMACAPIGAVFTALTLLTGSLWGKPMWGTYWEWDARMTSELILLFIYLAIMGLYQAIEDRRKAARAASLLVLVGLVNIPIIHYSVQWWSTLHQGVTVLDRKMDPSMLWPLLIVAVATKLIFATNLLQRTRLLLISTESRKRWVREMAKTETPS